MLAELKEKITAEKERHEILVLLLAKSPEALTEKDKEYIRHELNRTSEPMLQINDHQNDNFDCLMIDC